MKLRIYAFVIFLLFPWFVNGYEISTHKALSENIVREYERIYEDDDIQAYAQQIIDGAEYEDNHPRYLNHFYDPVSNKGLKKVGLQFPSSIQWATSPLLQSTKNPFTKSKIKLLEHPNDYSWQRAIYEYVHGDKKRAMRALGQVMHLVEDLTSVPHTRNDAHGGEKLGGVSVYEDFTKSKTPSVTLTHSVTYDSIYDLFNSTALYANTNFLSADTIFEEYALPQRDMETTRRGKLYQINDTGIYVAKFSYIFDPKRREFNVVGQTINDPKVMQSYWDHLSQKAVESGVALIDLFFREVEKEKKTHALKYMNKSKDEVKAFVKVIKRANRFGFLWGVKEAREKLAQMPKQERDGYKAAAQIYNMEIPEIRYTEEAQTKEVQKQQYSPKGSQKEIRQIGQKKEEKESKEMEKKANAKKKEVTPKSFKTHKKEAKSNVSADATENERSQNTQVEVEAIDYVQLQELLAQLQKVLEQYAVILQQQDICNGIDLTILKHSTCINPFDPGGYAFGAGGAGSFTCPPGSVYDPLPDGTPACAPDLSVVVPPPGVPVL